LPTARGALTANFINGILYAVGGVDISGTSNTNLAYDPEANTWIEKASMQNAREHLTSAVVGGKLHVIGGRTAGMVANVDTNEVYDPIKDMWTELSPMPSKRGGLASAAINETIYVFGGEEPNGTFNNNEKYDPVTDTWISAQPMPTARHGLTAVSVDDKIYIIGGGPQPGGSQTNSNGIFHPS
jgi:N-acetylneuraminic acid mutarotase